MQNVAQSEDVCAFMQAVQAVCSGDVGRAFAVVRPPGHHAECARAMGFCFYNNVAVAALAARQQQGIERVVVLDWDVHHGELQSSRTFQTFSVRSCAKASACTTQSQWPHCLCGPIECCRLKVLSCCSQGMALSTFCMTDQTSCTFPFTGTSKSTTLAVLCLTLPDTVFVHPHTAHEVHSLSVYLIT